MLHHDKKAGVYALFPVEGWPGDSNTPGSKYKGKADELEDEMDRDSFD